MDLPASQRPSCWQTVATPPTILEQREVMAEHFRLAAQIYGDERASVSMRKFGIKYARTILSLSP